MTLFEQEQYLLLVNKSNVSFCQEQCPVFVGQAATPCFGTGAMSCFGIRTTLCFELDIVLVSQQAQRLVFEQGQWLVSNQHNVSFSSKASALRFEQER